MRKTGAFFAVAIIPMLAPVFGCSGASSSTGASGNPFVGMWSCSNSETDTVGALTLPPKPSTTTVAITDQGNGNISASVVSDASDPCQLKFSTSGGTATLQNGQSCTSGGATATFTSGTYTVSGNTLTGSFQANFTGTVGGVQASGTLTQSSTCSRM